MRFAHLLARARRPVRRFLRDKRGVSAVEFAMLLPLMVTLYLGSVEVSSAIAVDRKVTLVSRTLGDLVAQALNIQSSTDMTSIFDAASSVIQPYSSTLIQATVSSVVVDANGVAKVIWSNTRNGTARAAGSTVTLPVALNTPSTSLIWAEAQYTYTPTIGYVITGPMTLKDQIYLRPRQSNCVLRYGVTSPSPPC